MGSALARATLAANLKTTVWNRTAERAAPLAEAGALVADSVEHAVADADLVIVNVSDYAASTALLRTPTVAVALKGRLVVELTSGSPAEAREAAQWAEEHGIAYLDGAIMASPPFIGTPGCTILISGQREGFDRAQPALKALGGNVQHVADDPGAASVFDSALINILVFSLLGTMQATAFLEAEGLPVGALQDHWAGTAPVAVEAVSDLIRRTAAGRFAGDAETYATVGVYHGAFDHILHLVRHHGLDPAAFDAVQAIFARALADGRAEADFAAMTRYLRPA